MTDKATALRDKIIETWSDPELGGDRPFQARMLLTDLAIEDMAIEAADTALNYLAMAEHLDAQKPRPLAVGDRVRVVRPNLANGERSTIFSAGDEGVVTAETDFEGDIRFQRDGTSKGYAIGADNVRLIEYPRDLFARNLEAFKHEAETPMREHGECCDPAPALPTESGALIIASGTSDGEPFENVALMLDCGQWNGRVPGGAVHLHSMTYDTDEITEWVEAVAVPKAEYDVLREAVRDLASIGPHSSSVTPRFTVVNLAFELVNAAEEAER